jgi:hypothetical protein
MNDVKGILLSKTFWGIVLMLLAKFVPHLAGISAEDVVEVVSAVLTAVGAVVALIGRITAKATIKGIL